MDEIESLQELLGVSFNNPELLHQALVHRSYLNENPGFCLPSNERLEFLGDALLGLVVAERLYEGFPEFQEGRLTKLRSALVRTDTLARIARSLRLGDYLLLGKGEAETGGRHKKRNLAAAFEAVIGAVTVDQGFESARQVVLRVMESELKPALDQETERDPKSRLQEVIQARREPPPTYRIVDAAGPDHARTFTVEVLAGDAILGCGVGSSKRKAEQEAARAALAEMGRGGEDLVQRIQEDEGEP